MKMTVGVMAAAAGALAVMAYMVMNRPMLQHETGSDTLESAARKTSDWGSKNRLTGAGRSVFGKAKEMVGRATGNADMANSGADEGAAGDLTRAAGEVAQAAGQTIHNLNR